MNNYNIYTKKIRTRAVALFREKDTDQDDDVKEVIVWKVPRNDRHPEGVRYRLAFIPKGHDRPAVLYDNHHTKGHHKHLMDSEHAYVFVDVSKLLNDFYQDVIQWKRKWRLLQ